MLIWDNYKVSVTRSVPWSQTHQSGKQSPKLPGPASATVQGNVALPLGDRAGRNGRPGVSETQDAASSPEGSETLGESLRLYFLVFNVGTMASASRSGALTRQLT